MDSVHTVERRIEALHPKFSSVVERLAQTLTRKYEAGLLKTHFKVFETYRSPVRQLYLLSEGTTKAGPWKSAHQFGLAVDFVPFVDGKWIWPPLESMEWKQLRNEANALGLLTPIAWDAPHIESPFWPRVKAALNT